ncbi:hypothetical protein J4573_39130 [Actinomadura barringtoniae]|uniref:Uncharacterized protein n=1 Tax=Actinomadura barringtoniae TaxID=1427535 RepID=A0A939PI63_9ACTN|nr:hypothetical protein [Actinomadura barringtoniae]MBO2453161.1 hypothetical protein [Actinomadura barringtoniae]
MVVAFAIGGAITTVMAFALGFGACAVSTGLGQILVLCILRLVSALVLGVAMALPFLIAKARGPLAPVAAIIGGLVAERVGTLSVGLVRGGDGAHVVQVEFGLSNSTTALYSLVNWMAILLVPVVAGGLTAIFALRTPKQRPAGFVPAGPYGPGQPAFSQYRQPPTPFTNPPVNPAVPPAAPNPPVNPAVPPTAPSPGTPPQPPRGT